MRGTTTKTGTIMAALVLAFMLPGATGGGALAAPSAAAPASASRAPAGEGEIDALMGERDWYQGGTLHRSTLAEWADASARNRLATAGDWTARMFSPQRLYGMGLSGIRNHAEALVACVDDVADTGRNAGQRSLRVAMACHLTMLSG